MLLSGTVPTFSQSSPVYISENTAVGTSVAVVSLTYDVGEYLMIMPSSPYLDYNSTSGRYTITINR